MDLGKILKGALPWIASALPGPFGAAAKEIVTGVLGLDKDSTTDEQIADAVAKATPEQLLALREEENKFKARMMEMQYKSVADLEEIAAGDRASARDREKTVKDKTPMVLAYILTLGEFCTLFWTLTHGIPAEGHDIILILITAQTTSWIAAITYYFGSTAGSRAKDDTIAKLPPLPSNP